MKLALLSDIHANLRALQACLDLARAAGATDYAVLGDLVGYGAEPAEVVDTVMGLAREGGRLLALTRSGGLFASSDGGKGWTRRGSADSGTVFLAAVPEGGPG